MDGHLHIGDVAQRMALDVRLQMMLQVRNTEDAAERNNADETDDPDQNGGRTSGKILFGRTGEGGVVPPG